MEGDRDTDTGWPCQLKTVLRTFCLSLLSSSEGILLDLLFVCLFVLVSRQGKGRYQSKRKNLFLTILCLVYIKFLSSGVPLLLLKLHFLLRYFTAKERERLLGLKGREHPAQTSFSAVFGSQCSSYAGSMHPYVSKFCLCAFWKHKIRVISLLLKWPTS